MFRHFSSRSIRVGLVAGLVGLAVPLMGAGPEVTIGGIAFDPPGFGKFKVRIGSPRRPDNRHYEPRPQPRRDHFAMPCELDLSAFQSGNTVIVVANGANHESGYITHFEACELSGGTPEVHLHNHRNSDHCAHVLTRFEATGSFTSRRQISCIKVRLGDQCREVRVIQTPCL